VSTSATPHPSERGFLMCSRTRRTGQVLGCRDKILLILEGRHGTDRNLAVSFGAVPYTVQEHECRGMIAPGKAFVHSMLACMRAAIAVKPMDRLRGCSCARAVGCKC